MSSLTIRAMEPRDVSHVVRIAIASGLFPAEATAFLAGSAQSWFEGGPGHWLVGDLAGTVVGVAFYEPRPATDRVWSLTMLAVDPSVQGSGRGAALLRHVESLLQARGQRILVIETSGTETYDRTRRFYERLEFLAVARVPDYFADGDDMVLFSKDLRVRRSQPST
jgi:ribosomal protein S18 acetylase RimI-like enzyme